MHTSKGHPCSSGSGVPIKLKNLKVSPETYQTIRAASRPYTDPTYQSTNGYRTLTFINIVNLGSQQFSNPVLFKPPWSKWSPDGARPSTFNPEGVRRPAHILRHSSPELFAYTYSNYSIYSIYISYISNISYIIYQPPMANLNSRADYEVPKLTIATTHAGNEHGRDNETHDLIRALQSSVATEDNSSHGIGYSLSTPRNLHYDSTRPSGLATSLINTPVSFYQSAPGPASYASSPEQSLSLHNEEYHHQESIDSADEDDRHCEYTLCRYGPRSQEYMNAILRKVQNKDRRENIPQWNPTNSGHLFNPADIQPIQRNPFSISMVSAADNVTPRSIQRFQFINPLYANYQALNSPLPNFMARETRPSTDSMTTNFSNVSDSTSHSYVNTAAAELPLGQRILYTPPVTPRNPFSVGPALTSSLRLPNGQLASTFEPSKRQRFVNQSDEHVALFHASRRFFGRYFSIAESDAQSLVDLYCPNDDSDTKQAALRSLDRWRINWQTKQIRDLKDHIMRIAKRFPHPPIHELDENQLVDLFANEFYDTEMMKSTVFSTISSVIDVDVIIRDQGLLGEMYRDWYFEMVKLMIRDMQPVDGEKWTTSHVFNRNVYDRFRGFARDEKFDSITVEGLPGVPLPPKPVETARSRKRNANKMASATAENSEAKRVKSEVDIDSQIFT
ncbi:hypothetical protein BZA77DRAFT_293562 [Pyronema omphalodes]|nr:hypothetical protein BZA77DRAFT_293562 [Pyronema omphalodes]